MKSATKLPPELKGELIVSCQAFDGSPFRNSESIARFAQAAVQGGAAGIRANGVEDIRAIRRAVGVPIIGIWKARQDDGEILITPSFEAAQKLVEAGAGLVALDCTGRGQKHGALSRLRRIQDELGVPVLADIATVEEAVQAAQAGADAVLSTLRGYTPATRQVQAFEPFFIAQLTQAVDVPVIAEGRIQTSAQVRAALEAGAYAVIVGTAITRPELITREFVAAAHGWQRAHDPKRVFVGIDMGGTRTKFGLVSNRGDMLYQSSAPTPWNEGRDALPRALKADDRRVFAGSTGARRCARGYRSCHRGLGGSPYRLRCIRHRQPSRLDGSQPRRAFAPGVWPSGRRGERRERPRRRRKAFWRR